MFYKNKIELSEEKNLSPWIAWSFVILAFGIGLYCAWYYQFQVGVYYDEASSYVLSVKNQITGKIGPTDYWKTNLDNSHKYAIKYPRSLKLDFEVADKEDQTFFLTNDSLEKNIMTIGSIATTDSLEQIINNDHYGSILSSLNKTTFSGVTAYEGVESVFGSYEYTILFVNNNYFYNITLPTNGKSSLDALKQGLTTDQKNMLSSFQFI